MRASRKKEREYFEELKSFYSLGDDSAYDRGHEFIFNLWDNDRIDTHQFTGLSLINRQLRQEYVHG